MCYESCLIRLKQRKLVGPKIFNRRGTRRRHMQTSARNQAMTRDTRGTTGNDFLDNYYQGPS